METGYETFKKESLSSNTQLFILPLEVMFTSAEESNAVLRTFLHKMNFTQKLKLVYEKKIKCKHFFSENFTAASKQGNANVSSRCGFQSKIHSLGITMPPL